MCKFKRPKSIMHLAFTIIKLSDIMYFLRLKSWGLMYFLVQNIRLIDNNLFCLTFYLDILSVNSHGNGSLVTNKASPVHTLSFATVGSNAIKLDFTLSLICLLWLVLGDLHINRKFFVASNSYVLYLKNEFSWSSTYPTLYMCLVYLKVLTRKETYYSGYNLF